jgi:hypothetical protein
MHQNLRGSRKFSGDLKYSNAGIDSRQACPESRRRSAKYAKFGIESVIILQTILFIFLDLCGLGVPSTLLRTCFAGNIPISFLRFLRPLRLIFRFRILFGCGFAALGSLWLDFLPGFLFRVLRYLRGKIRSAPT